MNSIVLESCHVLHRRPQFTEATARIEQRSCGLRRVTTAQCGCENSTHIVEDVGPSADGLTMLCEQHSAD